MKIGDFGFAKKQIGDKHTLGIGTPKYMSPELLDCRDDYDDKVDIWALGWIFYEILYGVDPWNVQSARSYGEVADTIANNELKFNKNVNVNPKIKEVIAGMLELDFSDRLSSTDAKEMIYSIKI